MKIVSEAIEQVAERINASIKQQDDPASAIIKGVEELWDVSLIKFAYEFTLSSLQRNVTEFAQQGLLRVDRAGIPGEARRYIEELFIKAESEPQRANELVTELERWGLFSEYQDRFFRLFRRK